MAVVVDNITRGGERNDLRGHRSHDVIKRPFNASTVRYTAYTLDRRPSEFYECGKITNTMAKKGCDPNGRLQSDIHLQGEHDFFITLIRDAFDCTEYLCIIINIPTDIIKYYMLTGKRRKQVAGRLRASQRKFGGEETSYPFHPCTMPLYDGRHFYRYYYHYVYTYHILQSIDIHATYLLQNM